MCRPIIYIVIALMLLATGGLAQNSPNQQGISNISGVGARAMGMGGAFTAIADDATAATWNPAGLAKLTRPEASFVYDYFDSSFKDEDYLYGYKFELNFGDGLVLEWDVQETLVDQDSGSSYDTPSFASFTYPFSVGKHLLVTQFSARRLVKFPTFQDFYSGIVSETDRWLLDGVVIDEYTFEDLSFDDRFVEEISGGIDTYSLSFAFSPAQSLRLGMTINYLDADSTERSVRTYTYSDGSSETDMRNRNQSFSDWFLDVGFQWEMSKKWTLGAVYHSGFTADFQFSDSLSSASPWSTHNGESVASGEGELTWPESYALGIAFKPTTLLTFAVDFSETKWSKGRRDHFSFAAYDYVGYDQETGKSIWEPTTITATNLGYPNFGEQEDTNAIRFGAEYLFSVSSVFIPVRAGYFEEDQISSLYPDFNSNPSTIEGFTLGSGIVISRGQKAFQFDLAWVHSESDDAIFGVLTEDLGFGDTLTETFSNRVKTSGDRFIGSIILRF